MSFDIYSSGYNAGYLDDDAHFEVMERTCEECGEPGACMSSGTLCVKCWEREGQPIPDTKELIRREDVRKFRRTAFDDV